MSSLQPLKRIYAGPDVDMKNDTRRIYKCFLEYINDFTSFDPDFDSAYSSKFLNALDDADKIESKYAVDANLKLLTKTVEEKMELCRNKFQSAKYFIEKAFPNNENIWQEFGYGAYNKARKNQVLMKEFMRNFYKTATKYSAKLIGANYTTEKIEEINTLLSELLQSDDEQESFKNGRPSLTQDNIEKLNLSYSIAAKVADVGKQIYAQDYAKHKKYVLSTVPMQDQVTPPADPNNPPV